NLGMDIHEDTSNEEPTQATHLDHEGENNEQAGTQEPTTSGGEQNVQEEPQASTETHTQEQ
ncbi:unnamed protein product, partial [Cochlearia groenlandica]